MNKDLEVIFENDQVVVINKPFGLPVHGDGVRTDATVVDWFLEHYPAAKGVGEEKVGRKGLSVERSGIVHRLDIDTSGAMVLAKTPEAFESLKEQFKNRTAKKEYRALVYGNMKEKWGSIERPIGRSARDFRLRSAQRGAKGLMRDALTNWELIGQGSHEGEPFAYLKLKPKTGRMHQLRVHLKAIDKPIVGDVLYAGEKLEISNNLLLSRLALHAHTLELDIPGHGHERLVAPVPLTIEQAVDLLHEE